MDQKTAAFIRKIVAEHRDMQGQLDRLQALLEEAASAPRSITEEIDALPGRRIVYSLVGRQEFDINQDGLRADPINFLVSQDGPFVMTHYPMVAWKPNSPAGATNFGQWSPISSWPLPAQQVADQDSINLSYELFDGGSQRAFQNEVVPPVLSRPDVLAPLPVPTLFAPNSNIQFFPTYEDIMFDADAATPADGGVLVVALPGYRIVNL